MRALSSILFGVTLAMALACGGSGSTSFDLGVPVVGEWANYGAPFGSGASVVTSDDERLVVMYPIGDRESLLKPYVDALKGDGWEEIFHNNDGDTTTYSLKKGDRSVGVTAVDISAMSQTTVSILFTGN